MNGLTQEDIEFIKNLSHEMKTQDNRCTAQPYALVIRDENTTWGLDSDYAQNTGLYWNDGGDPKVYNEEDWDEFLGELKEYGYDELLNEIEEYSVDNFSEMDNYCSVPDEFTITGYSTEKTADSSSGMYEGNLFLTEKACLAHIESNRHHFKNPDTYGIHLTRNPEMEKLYEVIHKLAEVL